MFGVKKQDITQELEQRIYKSNAGFLFICSFIVFLTNLFWIFVDIKEYGFSSSLISPRFIVISLLILFSAAVAFCLWPKKDRSSEFVCLLMKLYFVAIGSETTILCITKNIAAFEAGQPYDGIPLSSLYLFIFACAPFVDLLDSVYVVIPVLSTVFLPMFMPGHESYNPVAQAVMGFSIIAGCYAHRRLLISEHSNWLNLKEEQARFKAFTVQSLETISATIDAKNPYLKGHSKRVALYARDIARRLDMSEVDVSKLYFCGLLHDVGKIAIPSKILNKPDSLTDEEFKMIKNHTVFGSDILGNMDVYPELCECARSHHERFDGKGYPDGRSGIDLPLFVKIITVADAYDAMTSKRSYRDALDKQTVIEQFRKGRGSQFDPVLTDIIVELLTEQDWHYDA